MKYIDRRNVNLKNATKITKNTFESNIYVKNKKAYKMYKKYRFYREMWRLSEKGPKVLLLEDATAKQLVKPDAVILNKGQISGIRMNYIDNLGTLYNFSRIFNDLSKFLFVSKSASIGLKEIHDDPVEIVVNDLSFYNIVFDELLNTYYVDADSFEIGPYVATSVSEHFFSYCKARNVSTYPACATNDRFQFMYEFLSTIFGTSIEYVTPYEYDSLAERVETLKNMRLCFKKIKKSDHVPNLPYVSDLISDTDLTHKIEYDLPEINCKDVIKPVKQLTR